MLTSQGCLPLCLWPLNRLSAPGCFSSWLSSKGTLIVLFLPQRKLNVTCDTCLAITIINERAEVCHPYRCHGFAAHSLIICGLTCLTWNQNTHVRMTLQITTPPPPPPPPLSFVCHRLQVSICQKQRAEGRSILFKTLAPVGINVVNTGSTRCSLTIQPCFTCGFLSESLAIFKKLPKQRRSSRNTNAQTKLASDVCCWSAAAAAGAFVMHHFFTVWCLMSREPPIITNNT